LTTRMLITAHPLYSEPFGWLAHPEGWASRT